MLEFIIASEVARAHYEDLLREAEAERLAPRAEPLGARLSRVFRLGLANIVLFYSLRPH